MNDTLNYLQKYLREPEVFSTPFDNELILSVLPAWWKSVLQATGSDRVQLTLKAWEEYKDKFPTVFQFLSMYLNQVSLLTDKHPLSGELFARLLYEFDCGDKKPFYYVGGNPCQKTIPPAVADIWHKLPKNFTKFYDTFHNGWYYLASVTMGPSPVEDFFFWTNLNGVFLMKSMIPDLI